MDTSSRLSQHFLSCSICMDIFKDPCTIECGHSFCRGCLAEFIKTQQDAVRARSFVCPFCRQVTKVPKPSKPVGDWPKQFKPHFLVQGLLDEFATAADAARDAEIPIGRLCFQCQKIGKTSPAGYWCEDCEFTLCEDCTKIHKTIPVTRHHAISHLHKEVTEKATGRTSVSCKQHNSPLHFCCRDCNKIICQKCKSTHKKCSSIVRLESMEEEMTSAVKKSKEHVTTAVEELQTKLAVELSLMEMIEQTKASLHSDIKRVSQEAICMIEEKEKRLVDELNELTDKQTGQLSGQIKSGETDLQMFQQYSEFIDQALKSASYVNLYDVYQMCQSGAVKVALDRADDDSAKFSMDKITFVDRLEMQAFGEIIKLGRLEMVQDEPKRTKTPELQDTFTIRTTLDNDEPTASDVTVLDVDGVETVVITDSSNHCLKSFYTISNQRRCSTMSLPHEPHSVSKLKQNQVGVSFSSHKEIFLVRVNPSVVLQASIVTEKEYRCLAALNQRELVTGCWTPSSIDILDLTGKVLKSITTVTADESLIQYPEVLCITNKGHILVSDYGSQSVYSLTSQGEALFTYTMTGDRSLGGPRGITSTNTGDVLVVDYGKEKVVLLTEKGTLTCDLLTREDGLQQPRALFWHRDRLYITEMFKDTMKVFKLHARRD